MGEVEKLKFHHRGTEKTGAVENCIEWKDARSFYYIVDFCSLVRRVVND